MKDKKIYWKGLEQLENSEKFQERASREFPEYLNDCDGEDVLDHSRRDFLKMMGFSLAAVSVAACEAPIRKAIPYVRKPVEVDAGIPNYYASTYSVGNDYCSVVVKTREGRPIKIEGNTLSSVSGGGTTPQVEASVLSLYDESRLRNPKIDGEDVDWQMLDQKVIADLKANTKKTVIVSYTNCSPSTKKVMDIFAEKCQNFQWVQYDPLSMSAMLDAYEELEIGEGKTAGRGVPNHDFSKAKVIVSFEADILSNWPNVSQVNRQFASGRKINDDNKEMSRLYAFESNLSLTGSNADYRVPVRASQQGLYIANLYNKLAESLGGDSISVEKINDPILDKVAEDLIRNENKSLVVCGINDVYVQKIVIAMNKLLRSYGNVISINKRVNTRKGDDKKFKQLVDELKGGEIGVVVFYNCNPVYDHPLGMELEVGMGNAVSISSSDKENETGYLCKYLAPDHHYLESWNDFEPVSGEFSFSQPTISPIFNTRQVQDSVLQWLGDESGFYDFLKSNWVGGEEGSLFTQLNWDDCLQNGVYFSKKTFQSDPILPFFDLEKLSIEGVDAMINERYKSQTASNELVVYLSRTVGNGLHANNPWLQEMPDPITKVCWDNYLTVSPKFAKENGLVYDDERMIAKKADISINGFDINIPVIPQPGQAEGTFGLALGYGRVKSGKVGDNIGVNAYHLLEVVEGSVKYDNLGAVEIKPLDETYPLAQTQTSQTYAERETVIQESTLAAYKKDSKAGRYFPKIATYHGAESPYAVSIWEGHEYPNHHWGMVIDLNSCTGCGTCSVACHTENNVPVVGKKEVLNRREMHWVRIDRYYSSSSEDIEKASKNPEIVHQPMMCQHCNSAPCETVCPVAATTHSTEGLNQMAYNRCIGTRYCANNCPYKVRRFNWFKYHDNSQFEDNLSMNNDLGKMVLNPDVTVRSRGVMEKCSFCIQRIQEGKLKAKREGRKMMDDDVISACAQSCPADAIVFGDMNNPESKISKLLKIERGDKYVEAKEPRAYHVLEELRVMPNVWYLTKIRNKEENIDL